MSNPAPTPHPHDPLDPLLAACFRARHAADELHHDLNDLSTHVPGAVALTFISDRLNDYLRAVEERVAQLDAREHRLPGGPSHE